MTEDDFRRIALSLEGTTEAPHFDRRAFKVNRTYATLAADGLTANINFLPEEQEFRCMLQPAAYRRISNKWGDAGWTTAFLSALTDDDLRAALEGPWRRASQPSRKRKPR